MKRRLCWLIVCSLVTGTALAGERHALLIGVGDLPALPRTAWLAGPRLDVAAMQGALRQQGFAPGHITRLADGGAGGTEPTRAAILAQLAQLEKTLGKDDVLLLYWSGHSVLAPGYPGDATAPGQRTRLLTRDSRIDAGGRLAGGIASAELGRAIDALSARQVQVVAVFDTCHAAAGTRAGDDLVWRGLAAADLGWRQRAASDTGTEAARARPRFVGFFAAEAQQRTPESRSVPAPGQAAGLFTRAVIAALQTQPATYAVWAGSASAQYRAALQSYHLPRSAWPSPCFPLPLWPRLLLLLRRLPLVPPCRYSRPGAARTAACPRSTKCGWLISSPRWKRRWPRIWPKSTLLPATRPRLLSRIPLPRWSVAGKR